MSKKVKKQPERFCPDCDMGAEHPTTEGVCPRCGFVFLNSPARVEWFPSEEGEIEFGVAEGTPLWNYLDELGKYHEPTEDSASDQPDPQGRGEAVRVGLNDDQDGKNARRLENRLRAIVAYYGDDTAQEGFDIDKIRKYAFGADIGPDHAPHKEEPNRLRERQTLPDPS